MNILIITQLYPQPDDFGDNKPTRTVEYFAKEWVESGHKVVVAHCSSKFPLPFYFIPPTLKNKLAGATSNIFPPLSSRRKLHRKEFEIDVYRFPMLKALPGRGYSSRMMSKQSDMICKVIEGDSFIPDLVVGHFANPSTELVSIIAKKYNAKSSIVFHGDCNENTVDRYKLKELAPTIGTIGVRSMVEGMMVKEILNLEEIPFVCCSGVPNNAITNAAKECSKQDYKNGIKYLYVGSFIKRKHLDAVIKAFDSIAQEKDTLTIVGGGPEENSIKELVQSCNHDNQIKLVGRVSRDKVLEYMKDSHVFTLISDGEVFGMVYIEAMLQGCITIASSGGGFDGIIKNGINGYLCEPGNQKNLENLYRIISKVTPEKANTIGQNAIDTAIHFSEKEVADKYLSDILNTQRNRQK